MKAPQLSQELRVEWNAMTHEEKVEATKDAIVELQSQREEQSTAGHNAALTAFNDNRANLNLIEQQVRSLH